MAPEPASPRSPLRTIGAAVLALALLFAVAAVINAVALRVPGSAPLDIWVALLVLAAGCAVLGGACIAWAIRRHRGRGPSDGSA
jgi:hypothetical protein